MLNSFIHSIFHSFSLPLTHSLPHFIHSFHSFHSFIHLFIHSFIFFSIVIILMYFFNSLFDSFACCRLFFICVIYASNLSTFQLLLSKYPILVLRILLSHLWCFSLCYVCYNLKCMLPNLLLIYHYHLSPFLFLNSQELVLVHILLLILH